MRHVLGQRDGTRYLIIQKNKKGYERRVDRDVDSIFGLPPTFSYEDISSYGVEGLIDAVEKFSPKMGARFETYALVRIRGNIIDKIRSQDFLPRSVRRKIKDVKEAQEELKKQFGRAATNTEIANFLGIEREKVEQLLSDDTTVTSIYDKKGSSDGDIEIIDTIQD